MLALLYITSAIQRLRPIIHVHLPSVRLAPASITIEAQSGITPNLPYHLLECLISLLKSYTICGGHLRCAYHSV